MPSFEKWLNSADPEMPTDRVARRALRTRLRAVAHFLDKAVGDDDEAEHVHQLRVWSRRASAALRLFSPALAKGPKKRTKKTLRKLRRRAGAIRDCDVHLASLEETDDAPREIVAALKRERRAARKKLKAQRRRLQKGDRFENQIKKLLGGIAWPKRHSSRAAPAFGIWCRYELTPLAAEFFKLASADLHDDATLHALRIAGKRLRYALELAPAAIAAREHRWLYQELSDLQDRLGKVCDHLAAIDRAGGWLDDAKQGGDRRQIRALLREEKERLSASRKKLLRWWTAARRNRLKERWQKAIAK